MTDGVEATSEVAHHSDSLADLLQGVGTAFQKAREELAISLNLAKIIMWNIDLRTQDMVTQGVLEDYGDSDLGGNIVEEIDRHMHPEDREKVATGLMNAVQRRGRYSMEYRAIWRDHSIHWLRTTGAVICDGAGVPNHVLGVTQDITPIKTLERLLQEERNRVTVLEEELRLARHEHPDAQLIHEERTAKESAQSLNRELMAERDIREHFVAALTHDLRTPLSSVRLTAQLIQRRTKDQSIQDALRRVITSAERADAMIRDLLDANRLKAGEGLVLKREACDVDAVVRYIADEMSAMFGNRFVVYNNAGPVRGFWDRHSLERVVENLVGNAVKYGDPDGIVTIRLGLEDDTLDLAVHNDGNPIAEEDQKSLFHLYRRLRSAVRSGKHGWGIGLTLVRGIAEAHGGSVHVESSPDSGTTFHVKLPLHEPAKGEVCESMH